MSIVSSHGLHKLKLLFPCIENVPRFSSKTIVLIRCFLPCASKCVGSKVALDSNPVIIVYKVRNMAIFLTKTAFISRADDFYDGRMPFSGFKISPPIHFHYKNIFFKHISDCVRLKDGPRIPGSLCLPPMKTRELFFLRISYDMFCISWTRRWRAHRSTPAFGVPRLFPAVLASRDC